MCVLLVSSCLELSGFLDPWKVCFLPQTREVLQPLFLQVTFLPLSLPLLLLAPLYMNIFCLMLSQRSLSLSSLKFFFFFSFCCSVWVSPIVLSSSLPIHSLASFSLLLSPCSIFFSLVITYVWYFLILMSLCWSSHCIHLFFSQVQWVPSWLLLWTLDR